LKPRKVSRTKALTVALLTLALVAVLPPCSALTDQATIVIGSSVLAYPDGGLAFDPLGNLWVADLQNSRVLGFISPFSSDMAPSIVLGQPDLKMWGGSSWYDNGMTYPTHVTFDLRGDMWVADTYNHRVLEFVPPFRSGMNASLTLGQRMIPTPAWNLLDWSSTSPATTRNGLTDPEGIIFDASGDLWIADSWNGRVLEFQPPFSNNMNASLVLGEQGFTSSCNESVRPLCGDRRTLNEPTAIAFDASGNLWVTDHANLGTYAWPVWQGRLLEFKPTFTNGMSASLVISEPAGTSSLAFDSLGNLWLGCAGCKSNAGGYVSEYSSPFSNSMTPSLIIGGNNTGITSRTVTNPTGLTFDSAGNLWIVDSNRVLGFNINPHSVLASKGRVYVQNDNGILTSLSAFSPPMNASSYPEGLFNFTIQGLHAGGSVKLTITFPKALPSEVGWVNVVGGNPSGSGTVERSQLPASMVQVDGNNMTLTLTNASQEGIISMVGGPEVPIAPAQVSNTTSSNTSASTTPPLPNIDGFLVELIAGGAVAGLVAMTILRNRKRLKQDS